MNINDLKIDLTLSINGARITPTLGQLDQIHKYIYSTVFRSSPQEPQDDGKSVKRVYRKKGAKIKWSDEEVKIAHRLRFEEGHSVPRVAKMLSTMFPHKRSDKSVSLMFHNHKHLRKPTGIFENIQPKVETTTTDNLDDFQI